MCFDEKAINLFMTGYTEGKNDDLAFPTPIHTATKKKAYMNPRAQRRKAGFFKARKRLLQLEATERGVPHKKPIDRTLGMLRSHQLPMEDSSSKFHISDKRRQDAVNLKLAEIA